MSRWVVRWLPGPVSGPAPRERLVGRADRRATTHIWSPKGSNFELTDVTFSGATTAHLLADHQHAAPPQITTLDGSESLVTVTIGGNDVGYVPLLIAAALPRGARRLPLLGGRISELLDRDARDRALAEVLHSLCAVGREVRKRAPHARIFFVDYLTMLPPEGVPAPPLSEADADLGRHVASTLEKLTADAAAQTGCEIIRAGAASRDHHAWSAEPWTTTPAQIHCAAAGSASAATPQCGRDARGGGT